MASFTLPLGGPVNQLIAPWTAFLSPSGGQYGLININLGRSSAPEIEGEVLSEVGSYGKQLGRIGDAMAVLLKHFQPKDALSDEDQAALDALKAMLIEIDGIKRHHGRGSKRRRGQAI